MAHVSVRPLAQNDLLNIWLYIAQSSEQSADSLMAQFAQKFELLAQTPHMGRQRPELSIEGLRSFPLSNYVIYYLPQSDGVDIVRVLHSRRDVSQLIQEPESEI